MKRYIRYSFCFIFLLSSYLIAEKDIEKSRQLENNITQQIESYLARVLESKQYIITTSATVSRERKQEITEEEENIYKKDPILPTNNIPAEEPEEELTEEESLFREIDSLGNLGFIDLEEPKPKEKKPKAPPQPILSKEETKNTFRTYAYQYEYTIDSVNVSVVFDRAIPVETRLSLQNVITKKIIDSYPNQSSVEFFISDLKAKEDKAIIDYIREYAVLFYIGLGIFVLFLLLMFVMFLMRLLLSAPRKKEPAPYTQRPPIVYPPKRRRKPKLPEPPKPLPPKEEIPKKELPKPEIKKEEEPKPQKENQDLLDIMALDPLEAYQKLESLFLNEFLTGPIVGRKFFKTLPKEKKSSLVHAIDTENIKNMFIGLDPSIKSLLNEPNPFEGGDQNTVIAEKNNIFVKGIADLRKYRKLINLQSYGYFGQLSLLDREELKKILDKIPVDELGIVLTHLEKDISKDYLKTVNSTRKKELMKALGSSESISQEKIEDLQAKFKEIIKEDIEKNIFVNSADDSFLIDSIINEVNDPKEILEELRTTNEDLYEEYKHLTISFEDFIAESGNLFKRTIEDSPNETIGKALVFMNETAKSKIMGILPVERKDIIEATILSNKNTLTKTESEEQQKNILDYYRKYKKDFL